MIERSTERYDGLEVTQTDAVLSLTLNVPSKRNALATDLLRQVAHQLALAADNPECRVAIITGGPDIFAAGADINEIAALDSSDPVESPRFVAWQSIRSFSKPLIAAVEGWCLGAGLELALSADIIVAGDGSRFGQPETNLGIIPGGGATGMLTLRVGRGLGSLMIFSGKPIDAERAHLAGLVTEVVPSGDALKVATALARELAGRAPLALTAAKACIRAVEEMPLSLQHYVERGRFIQLMDSTDKAEGIAAFLEKRSPAWTGN